MLPRELERLSKLREIAFSLPLGAPMELTLANHRTVSGVFDASTDDAVFVYTGPGQPTQVWMFEEIRTLRRLDRQCSSLWGSVRRFLAMLLVSLMSLSAATPEDVRAAALNLPNGVPVRVQTLQKTTLAGKFIGLTDQGVTLQLAEKDRITERTIAFTDIKSIKQTNKPMGAGKAVMLTLLVLYGIGAIMSAAIGG